MSWIRVGDTVTFRREVVKKCNAPAMSEFRGVVTGIAADWLFIEEASGKTKVMRIDDMCRVAPNGAVLELV